MSARQLDAIFRRARREAFPVVRDKLRAALPKGWRCVLAVGWGATVLDDQGRSVRVDGPLYHNDHPRRMPAPLRRALDLAERFGELYQFGNEDIVGR